MFLGGGFFATIILIGYVFGHNLFIPAIVCEGTDAIDAVQRGYTYFFAKPFRLVFYMLCGAAGLYIAVTVVSFLVLMTIGFAAQGASVWAGHDGSHMIWHGTFDAITSVPGLFRGGEFTDTPVKTWAAGASIIRFWTTIPVLLVLSAYLSCGISVCTAVYLGMRKVCDGQDWSELWVPGMIAGTMTQSLAGRAQVAQEMGTQRGSAPVTEAEDD